MADSYFLNHWFALTAALLIAASALCIDLADAQIGVCYGTEGNNLPSPEEVISLCNQHNIKRIRLYEPNQRILEALRGNIISITLGIPNQDIPEVAKSLSAAQAWVQTNIVDFYNVNFRYIAVGNNISPLDNTTSKYAPSVLPAMQNIANALSLARLGTKIKVSTVINLAVLGQVHPPSGAAFFPNVLSYVGPIIEFLGENNYPLLANLQAYLFYVSDPNGVSLDYALFGGRSPVVRDGFYQYWNLFDSLVDAVYVALEKYEVNNVEVVVAETGWPSSGGIAANIQNAKIFNNNLIQHVKGGTPRRVNKPVEAYIFDLFDENLKQLEYEKHWGLFNSNKQLKYPVRFE